MLLQEIYMYGMEHNGLMLDHFKVHKVQQELQEFKEQLDLKEQLAYKDQLAHKAFKAQLVHKVFKAFKELLVRKDQQAQQV